MEPRLIPYPILSGLIHFNIADSVSVIIIRQMLKLCPSAFDYELHIFRELSDSNHSRKMHMK